MSNKENNIELYTSELLGIPEKNIEIPEKNVEIPEKNVEIPEKNKLMKNNKISIEDFITVSLTN